MATSNLKQVVVILVEDEVGVRTAMKMLLEVYGYRVEAFASANEALAGSRYCAPAQIADASNRHSAVIVSDVRMPGLDGFEFLSVLRKQNVTVPFVLVSGHCSKDELSRGLALGAQGFLSKPYEPNDLCALIEEITSEAAVSDSDYPVAANIRD